METIDAIIAEHPFFKGLEPSVLKIVGGCGSNVRVNAGEYLFHEGEEADRFYAVRHGMVALEIYVPQRGQVTVQTVGAGELVGWSWLFPPYVYEFSARAIEMVRATSFDGACLRKKCDEDTAMGYELMKRLAQVISQRLGATRLQLLDIYGPAVQEK